MELSSVLFLPFPSSLLTLPSHYNTIFEHNSLGLEISPPSCYNLLHKLFAFEREVWSNGFRCYQAGWRFGSCARGSLPIGEPLPTVVVASRLRLASGDELDLLLLDSDGRFTLCELKREKVTRHVIGQILDYAAQLAEMSVDDIREQIEKAKCKLKKQVGDEWDEESFSDEALNESLKSPRLILVGWRIEEDAIRIARWLQRQGVVIECYEFDYFKSKSGETEIFVPRNLTPLEAEAVETMETKPLAPHQVRRREFWTDMLRRLGNRIPHRRNPTRENFLGFSTGIRGVWVEWNGGRSELRVRLVIRKEEQPELVKKLQGREILDTLKQEIGEEWSIYETPISLFVQTQKDAGTSVWEAPDDVREWGVETLVKLYNFIVPKLREWTGQSEED